MTEKARRPLRPVTVLVLGFLCIIVLGSLLLYLPVSRHKDSVISYLAQNLISRANLDMLPLSDDFSIISIDLNPIFAGKTVLELNWRKKYNVNVIALINNDHANATILPETVIEKGTRAVLSGTNEALEKFRDVNSKGLD